MDMRDRLVEILKNVNVIEMPTETFTETLADHLIANDVRIERHGEWEYIGTDKHGNVFRCSYCALRIGLDYETTYCPHCGAKMDLEE